MDQKVSRDYKILGGILLLALVLRVWGLNAPLWFDEIVTLETHVRLPWDEMMQSYSMNHHYLFSLQAKIATAVLGESAWALRLPALLFGLGTIAAIWWLARATVGRQAAHVTALLLALSFHHIWFSQNARGYTELAFWSSLGMVFFINGMVRPNLKTWLGYGLCLAFAVATHLTGVFFFFAQGLIWLGFATYHLFRQKELTPIITLPVIGFSLGAALSLMFYAPLLSSVIEVAGAVAETSSVDVMQEYQNPIWTVMEAIRTGVGSLGPLIGLIAIIAFGFIGLGGRVLFSSFSGQLITLTIVLHIFVTMVLLSMLGMRIWPRFFFIDIGFLMLLIVMGVHSATDFAAKSIRPLSAGPLFTAAVAAMVLVSCFMASRNYAAPKQNLEGAFNFVETERSAGDRIYAVGVAAPIFNDHFQADWGTIDDGAQISAALETPGSVIIVVAFPGRYYRVFPELDALASEGKLDLIKRLPGTLGDGHVLVLRRE